MFGHDRGSYAAGQEMGLHGEARTMKADARAASGAGCGPVPERRAPPAHARECGRVTRCASATRARARRLRVRGELGNTVRV